MDTRHESRREEEAGPEHGAPRRSFLKAAGAVFASLAAGLAPVAAGGAVLFDPLRRGERADSKTVKVATLPAIPDRGVPRRVTVMADHTDAWTRHQAAPVGAVFLRREGDELMALNVVCPHAGCSVNLAADGSHFRCPCHRSRFALDGTREEGPAPRGLDRLAVHVQGDEIWVRFQNFRPGTEEKIPV